MSTMTWIILTLLVLALIVMAGVLTVFVLAARDQEHEERAKIREHWGTRKRR